MVETGIAIGVSEGTYGRLATRSGMASKMGIALGGGIIDTDYRGEVKVILRNHGEADFLFRAGDRIAQLIIAPIANGDSMEVEDLGITERATTERAKLDSGSSDLNPKRSITVKEEGIKICFLHADTSDNEFFGAADIGSHPRLNVRKSNAIKCAHVNAAQTGTMND